MAGNSYLVPNTQEDSFFTKILKEGEIPLQDGKAEFFETQTNIKGFYNDLHDLLLTIGFKDKLQPGNHAKTGEFVDNKGNENRTGDMFETHYVVIEKGSVREFELKWEVEMSLPNSDYGGAKFTLDLVVRNMKDVEIVRDGKKVKLQQGKWEFRNKLIYTNSIHDDFLNKVPIVKNSDFLKKIYLDRFYKRQVKDDITFCVAKVRGKIYELIESYFR